MKFLQTIILLFFFVLEASVFSIPLVLVAIVCLTVLYRDYFIFFLAFLLGALLDITTFKSVGFSSLFYIVCIFLILMYERKFEINTIYFILCASFLGSFLYLFVFGYHNLITQTLISTMIGVMLFYILNKFNFKKLNTENG